VFCVKSTKWTGCLADWLDQITSLDTPGSYLPAERSRPLDRHPARLRPCSISRTQNFTLGAVHRDRQPPLSVCPLMDPPPHNSSFSLLADLRLGRRHGGLRRYHTFLAGVTAADTRGEPTYFPPRQTTFSSGHLPERGYPGERGVRERPTVTLGSRSTSWTGRISGYVRRTTTSVSAGRGIVTRLTSTSGWTMRLLSMDTR
jgi:hypothetical protein